MKTCTKCGEVKALDAFNKNKSRKDGLDSWCKTCARAKGAAYRKANREAISAKSAAYRKANRKANREAVSARNAAYRKANPEAFRARAAARVESLHHSYVAGKIGIPVAALTPELYALKREQIETHRLAKQLKQATKDEQHASI